MRNHCCIRARSLVVWTLGYADMTQWPQARRTLLPYAVQAYLPCRYVAFFSLRGIAEWALASGKLIAEGKGPTQDATQQEALMYQQLGMLKGMDKPAKWTSGLNWYR